MMNTCSSMTGFSESSEIPEAYVVDDNLIGENPWQALKIKLMFIYGSLPRPPDIHSGASYLHENGYNLQSSSGLNCLSYSLLVLWNQALFCYHGEYDFGIDRCCRNCYTEAVLPGYVHSQGEIWLKRISFMVDLICRNGVYISALLRFQCEDGHISSETFTLGDVVYGFCVIANAVMALQLRIFLKAEAHCFEVPVILYHAKLHAVMRRTYRSLNSFAIMDQLVVWFITSLLRLKEETSSFSCWRVCNARYASPSSLPRQKTMHHSVYEVDAPELVKLHCQLISVLSLTSIWWDCSPYYAFILQASADVVDAHNISNTSSPRWNEKLEDGLLRLRRACGFVRQSVAAHSGWLMPILALLRCSLPRPPEAHFMPLSSYGCFSWRRFLEVTSTWCLSMLQQQVGAELLTVLPNL